MPKQEITETGVKMVFDDNNPNDVKKKQKITKEYQTMSKPDLVKLVEKLLEAD